MKTISAVELEELQTVLEREDCRPSIDQDWRDLMDSHLPSIQSALKELQDLRVQHASLADGFAETLEAAQYCRPEVQGFARLMEAALRNKDAERGGNSWQNKTLAWEILPHLEYQVSVLREYISEAAKTSDEFDADMALDDAASHAVHAANFAMMICDLSGTLPRQPKEGTDQ